MSNQDETQDVADLKPLEPKKRSTATARGPKYAMKPMDRTVRTIAITEHEFTTLSVLNVGANFFFWLSGLSMATFVGLLLDYFQEQNTQTKSGEFVTAACLTAVALTAVFLAGGFGCIYWRNSEANLMKSESNGER